MDSEDPTKPQNPDERRSEREREIRPLFEVLAAYEHGMVIETDRDFDVGSAVELGFQLGNSSSRHGGFVSAETIVVESRLRVSKGGLLVHRVTLLFSAISRRDHLLLLDYSRERLTEKSAVPKELLGLQQLPAKMRLIESFEEIFSLN